MQVIFAQVNAHWPGSTTGGHAQRTHAHGRTSRNFFVANRHFSPAVRKRKRSRFTCRVANDLDDDIAVGADDVAEICKSAFQQDNGWGRPVCMRKVGARCSQEQPASQGPRHDGEKAKIASSPTRIRLVL